MTEDIFTPGVWVVLQPDGTPVENVCASTGYSARATALRKLNKHWSQLEDGGYRLVRCAPAACTDDLSFALQQLLAAAMPIRADGATVAQVAAAIPALYDACHSAALVLQRNAT